MSLMNVVNVWVFFRRPLDRNAGLAALVGLAGIALVFYPKLMEQNARADALLGLGLSMLATLLASFGNMVSVKLKALAIPVVQSNTIGMTYGAAFCAIFALINGSPFNFDSRPSFVVSLLGLALFASVFGFGAYLTLVQKIGAGRAGYTSVIFPIIALAISTFREGYQWTSLAAVGIALVLAGNLILLLRPRAAAPMPAPQLQKDPIGCTPR